MANRNRGEVSLLMVVGGCKVKLVKSPPFGLVVMCC